MKERTKERCRKRNEEREDISKVSLPSLAQNLLEGPSEVLVEDGVDDRIERAVAVANPEEELEERLRDLAWRPADSV